MREYLRLYGNLYGLADPAPAIEAGLARFRVEHLADAMGTELSSGQRTLVGIVRATLHRPAPARARRADRVARPRRRAAGPRPGCARSARRTGTALLVTSHDMAEVARLCERVMFLSQGRVVADGTPDEVAERFGRSDLEGVFLHLAEERRPEHEPPATQQTDHAL